MSLAPLIVQTVSQVSGSPASLHEPKITERERECVSECLDSGWVSTAGSFVERFERLISELTEVPHVAATMNGTAALHVALILAGVKNGDEVIMPSLTFVATANAASYIGAVPHFADVGVGTMGLDPAKLAVHLREIALRSDGVCINRATGRRISAIVCMHTYGHPVDLDPLVELADELGIALIEDAAEALGSFYKGRPAGSFGKLAVLSFNGNKIATAGAGGAILTSDPDLGARAKHLTTTAKISHSWEFDHDEIGFNYRLSNICAALGCAQLESLPSALRRKRKLAARYADAFKPVEGVSVFSEPTDCESNYWLNVILLDQANLSLRDEILQQSKEANLGMRPAWVPMHRLNMFESSPAMDLSVTEDLYERLLCLPSSPQLVSD